MKEIYIADFQQEDITKVIDLFYGTVWKINRIDYSEKAVAAWAPLEERENLLSAWTDSFLNNKTLVAKIDGKVAGFIDARADGYIDRLYVHKDKQRMGVAAALWLEVEKWAMQEEIPMIWTFASITAKGFFEKYGFQVVEEDIVERKGVLLTRFYMQKMLLEG